MSSPRELSRRDVLRSIAAAALVRLPSPQASEDLRRLTAWTSGLRASPSILGSIGRAATRIGELAAGSPYVPFTLEAYLKEGGNPAAEPLILSLTRFDCVTLVEACLAVARAAAAPGQPTWERFGAEVERMRYRGGTRRGYTSRLHYFTEWIRDGESTGTGPRSRRGTGRRDRRASAPVHDRTPLELRGPRQRRRVPGDRRAGTKPGYCRPSPGTCRPHSEVLDRIESGDVLAFATSIPGLDVTHAAFAYRDTKNVVRVLHAPLSGGVVEVTRTTLPQYVAAIRRATGILRRPTSGC